MVHTVFTHWLRGERWSVSFGTFGLVHARFSPQEVVVVFGPCLWGGSYIYIFFGPFCVASGFCCHSSFFYRKTLAEILKNFFGKNCFTADFFRSSSSAHVAVTILR